MDGWLEKEHVRVERTDKAVEFCKRLCYGRVLKTKIKLTLYEALYLLETKRLSVKNKRNQEITEEQLLRAGNKEKNFSVKYAVYHDLRKRGYIVKTALKFGADFRVYDKGVKVGQDHAKWIVFPVHESETNRWYDFAAKNRVAHSTRKRLLIGVVDEEDSVTYFEVHWTKP